MTELELYTFGGGEVLVQVFNAIASLLKPDDSALRGLFRLAILLGGVWVLLESIFKRNYFLNFKWWVSYFIVTSLLLSPSASVIIHDKLSHKSTAVDNVPLGLAILGHYTSIIGATLTVSLDTTFRLADDASNLSYSNSGFLMFSKMAEASTDFQISNPIFLQNIESFVKQCVFYDLLLNRYTMTDLKQQKNLWQFLSSHASRARAYMHNGEIIGCADGVSQLSQEWDSELDSSLRRYAYQLFSSSDAKQSNWVTSLFESNLTSTYSYLMGASESATNIMQQNMIINAMHSAMRGYAAETGAVAAMQNIDYLQAQTHKRRTNHTIGRMAEHWLPVMHVVFEAMIYGSFVFIALLAFMPFGFNVLKNYIFSLMWLQSWAPLYAILNLVMAVYAQHQVAGLGLADSDGALYLNYANHSQFGQIQADISSLAGYLSISIPFIAMGLVRGMSNVFTQLAQYIGGVTQSTAIGAASEATSGNYAMGNLSYANQSMHNHSGFKHDTNSLYATGQFIEHAMHGSEFRSSASGHTSINNRGALSQLAHTINISDAIRLSSSQQADMSLSAAYHHAQMASDMYNVGLTELNEFSDSHGYNVTSTDNTNLSTAGSINNAASSHQGTSHSMEKINSGIEMGTDRKSSLLYAATDATANFNSKDIGVIGKGLQKLGLSGSVSASGGYKKDTASITEQQETLTYNVLDKWNDDSSHTSGLEHQLRAAQDYAYHQGDEASQRQVEQIASRIETAQSYRDEASRLLNESHTYRELHQLSSDQSFSINADASQRFVEWANEQHGYTAQQIAYMDVYEQEEIKHLTQQFVKAESQQYIDNYKSAHTLNTGTVENEYTNMGGNISKAHNLSEQLSQNNVRVQSAVNKSNIKPVVNNVIGGATESIINEAKLATESRDET